LADYTRRKAFFDSFERRELKYVSRSLHRGGTAIDVGANVGLLTLAMAKSVGTEGKVLSFEPIPNNFNALNRAVAEIPQIEIQMKACGRNSGSTIRLSRVSSSGSDDAGTSGSYGITGDGTGELEVPLIALDDVIKSASLDRDVIQLLKIDVEGAEIDVLEGARTALNQGQFRTIILEAALSRDGFRKEDLRVMELLQSFGYKLHPISVRGRKMRCNLMDYPFKISAYPHWALKYTNTISLNYCAVI
jgi:FkbM family methyltransferase